MKKVLLILLALSSVLCAGEVLSNAARTIAGFPKKVMEKYKEAEEKHNLKEKYAAYRGAVESAKACALSTARDQFQKTKQRVLLGIKGVVEYAQNIKEKYYEGKSRPPKTEEPSELDLETENRLREVKELLKKYLKLMKKESEEETANLAAVSEEEEVPREDL